MSPSPTEALGATEATYWHAAYRSSCFETTEVLAPQAAQLYYAHF